MFAVCNTNKIKKATEKIHLSFLQLQHFLGYSIYRNIKT